MADKTDATRRVGEIHDLLKQLSQKMTDAYRHGVKVEFSLNTNPQGETMIAKFEAFEKLKMN